MKRLWFLALAVFACGLVFGDDFDTMTNDLSKILSDGSKAVSAALAKNLGYYTGSGNITAANASGFPGIKVGLGGGTAIPGYVWAVAFSKDASTLFSSGSKNASGVEGMAKAIGAVPLNYDMVYGKVGLPLMPLDVGLRLGYFPSIKWGTDDQYVQFGFFHIGGEVRYKITGINLVFAKSQLEARLSYDYDQGVLAAGQKIKQDAYADTTHIGTNEVAFGMENKWSGSSVGARLVMGLSVLMFDVYGGLGVNFNFGEVNTTLNGKVKFTPDPGPLTAQEVALTGTGKSPYDGFDLRLLVGTHIVFFDAGVEWNPLNNALAITVIPVSIAF